MAPAANLPEELAYRGLEDDDGAKLVIVNLQETPLEEVAALKISARCDDVMTLLLDLMGVPLDSTGK